MPNICKVVYENSKRAFELQPAYLEVSQPLPSTAAAVDSSADGPDECNALLKAGFYLQGSTVYGGTYGAVLILHVTDEQAAELEAEYAE